MLKKFQWSPSKLNDYDTCPRQFQKKHITKEIPFVQTVQMKWGTDVHKGLEVYVKDNEPLPDNMSMYQPIADGIRAMPGAKYTEQKAALREDLTSTTWFAQDVWGRMIVDLIVVAEDQQSAVVLDYKTGKVPRTEYYDPTQIILSCLWTFIQFPTVQSVAGSYLYVSHGKQSDIEVVRREEVDTHWSKIRQRVDVINQDKFFHPKPSGLCRGWCPVKECIFNKEYLGRAILNCPLKGQRTYVEVCAVKCQAKCEEYEKINGGG